MARNQNMATLLLALFAIQANAHFYLNYPSSIGFDDSLEGEPPCGSFTPNFSNDNVTDFHVGGDSLAMTSIHPQATWLFRATLDITASANWTDLLPAIVQVGLGDYCETNVKVPASFAGQKGIIQVVQDAPDGILFQCATVNFVTGAIAPPSICMNVTGLSASYTTDAALSMLPTATSTSTTTSSTSSGTATPKPSSSSTIYSYAQLSLLVGWIAIASASLIAFVL